MGDYLKLFETHTEYETYIEGQDVLLPNVSYCEDNNEVYYKPLEAKYDYSQDYLTFVALESGTFTFTSPPNSENVISYSTDGGETWTTGNSVTVNNGDIVMWKGTMTPQSSVGVGTFGATGNFDVQGNVMSLLFGDNYKEQTDLTGKGYAFYELFRNNTKVVNAENLSLPATTLADDCYMSMFKGCTSLVTAPELPATTLTGGCYNNMFQGCTNLVTAPELPATTLANWCYSYMFQDCTNLTEVAIVPSSVKPISYDYCLAMYYNTNIPFSSDYGEYAWTHPGGSND